MTRKDKVFAGIDAQGLGLEIGPSHNPLAPKREGFRVEIVDHLDRVGLIEKYRKHGVDLDAIEEVDHVWNGQPLSELVGGGPRFDWIIASHVIEHMPDLVGFLNECQKLLKPEGTISLVIPDKRYCFDHFRTLSNVGDLIQAHLEKRTRHPSGWVFDYFLSVVRLGGAIAWGQQHSGSFEHIHPLQQAIALYRQSLAPDAPYFDIHAWRFTPSSFRLILRDLHALQLIQLSEHSFFGTEGCEFYISLRTGTPPETDRLELSQAVQRELAEAIVSEPDLR